MKWYAGLSILALAAIPGTVSATPIKTVAIGNIATVNDPSPTMWGMSGMDIFRITQSIGAMTPIMRSETIDARTVEILSRTQAPPLRQSDFRVVSQNGRVFVTVRNYLLAEVMEKDARAEHTTKEALGHKWAAGARRVLPQVAPTPNRFGV